LDGDLTAKALLPEDLIWPNLQAMLNEAQNPYGNEDVLSENMKWADLSPGKARHTARATRTIFNSAVIDNEVLYGALLTV